MFEVESKRLLSLHFIHDFVSPPSYLSEAFSPGVEKQERLLHFARMSRHVGASAASGESSWEQDTSGTDSMNQTVTTTSACLPKHRKVLEARRRQKRPVERGRRSGMGSREGRGKGEAKNEDETSVCTKKRHRYRFSQGKNKKRNVRLN